MVHEFTVLDMTCGGCASSVKKAVSRVPGVSSVDTDVARHAVRVETNDDVLQETMVAAINKAGYYEVTPVTSGSSNVERWSNNALELASTNTAPRSGGGCCS
jgi:copper chaperone CopZ